MENPPSVPISSLRRANCELQGFIAFLLDLKEDQASEIGDWQCGGGFFFLNAVLKRQQLLHFLQLLSPEVSFGDLQLSTCNVYRTNTLKWDLLKESTYFIYLPMFFSEFQSTQK